MTPRLDLLGFGQRQADLAQSDERLCVGVTTCHRSARQRAGNTAPASGGDLSHLARQHLYSDMISTRVAVRSDTRDDRLERSPCDDRIDEAIASAVVELVDREPLPHEVVA